MVMMRQLSDKTKFVQVTKHIYDGLVTWKDIISGLDPCNENFSHQCTIFVFGGRHTKLIEARFDQLSYIIDNDQLLQPILHMTNDCL
jgi:hypothetical protein